MIIIVFVSYFKVIKFCLLSILAWFIFSITLSINTFNAFLHQLPYVIKILTIFILLAL